MIMLTTNQQRAAHSTYTNLNNRPVSKGTYCTSEATNNNFVFNPLLHCLLFITTPSRFSYCFTARMPTVDYLEAEEFGHQIPGLPVPSA
jgi:hypothetical protein